MEQMKEIPVGNSTIPAYHGFFSDAKKRPAVLVIHEIWGLNDHIKDVANRFLKVGYRVLAPDLFSDIDMQKEFNQTILDEMKDPLKKDEAQKKMRAILKPLQSPEFAKKTMEKIQACISYLLDEEESNGKIGVVGFCFGGTYSFETAVVDKRINAAIAFYGQSPDPLEDVKNISCPVLAFYGENDTALINQLPNLHDEMRRYNKEFYASVYAKTGHAFFNDTNARLYDNTAATDAWEKSLAFLQKNLL